jgi:hypothetical protein
MAQLADAKGRLSAVQSRLAELQAGFDESLAKKAELEAKAQRCETQLTNAGRLLGKRVPLCHYYMITVCKQLHVTAVLASVMMSGFCVRYTSACDCNEMLFTLPLHALAQLTFCTHTVHGTIATQLQQVVLVVRATDGQQL